MKIKLLLVTFIICCTSMMFGQTIFMKDFYKGKKSLTLDYNRADFDGAENKTFSGFYKLTYVHPVSEDYSIEGSISYLNNAYNDFASMDNGFGNIYLGVNKKYDSGKSNLSLGIYLPTASNDVLLMNAIIPATYNMGLVNTVGMMIRGNYAYHKVCESGLILGIEVGPDFFIATEENGSADDVIAYLHAAGRIGYKIDNFKIYGEITNYVNVTSDIDKFKNRFINNVGLGASYKVNDFEFGLNYKNTFEDYPSYNNDFGVSVKFSGF